MPEQEQNRPNAGSMGAIPDQFWHIMANWQGCCLAAPQLTHWHYRADSTLAPSQWETSLQSNAVSHWLGANLKSALHYFPVGTEPLHPSHVIKFYALFKIFVKTWWLPSIFSLAELGNKMASHALLDLQVLTSKWLELPQWGRNKMAVLWQTTFSNAFS